MRLAGTTTLLVTNHIAFHHKLWKLISYKSTKEGYTFVKGLINAKDTFTETLLSQVKRAEFILPQQNKPITCRLRLI